MLNMFLGTDDVSGRDGADRVATVSVPPSGLISRGEGVATEFKSTLRANLRTGQNDPRIEREVLKSIAAFLNSDGGVLFIGVDDKGNPLGFDADKFSSEDKMHLHLVNLIRDKIGPQHMLFIHPRFDDYGSMRVLIVDCKKSRAPVYVKDGNMEHFYIRTGCCNDGTHRRQDAAVHKASVSVSGSTKPEK